MLPHNFNFQRRTNNSYFSSVQNISPVEAAIVYKLLKSCDRKTLFDWLTANRYPGLYEVCNTGSTP
jgi:hypothetical protein